MDVTGLLVAPVAGSEIAMPAPLGIARVQVDPGMIAPGVRPGRVTPPFSDLTRPPARTPGIFVPAGAGSPRPALVKEFT
jgi:hypothetical protein